MEKDSKSNSEIYVLIDCARAGFPGQIRIEEWGVGFSVYSMLENASLSGTVYFSVTSTGILSSSD